MHTIREHPRLRSADVSRRDRYVYAIIGEDGRPCYVGLGKGSRMNDHVRHARRGLAHGNAEKSRYFVDCIRRGVVLSSYKVADGLTREEAQAFERLLIRWIGRRDLATGPLLNACDGGSVAREPSPDLRRLRSELMKSPEMKAKLAPFRARQAGRKMGPEARANMKAAARLRWTPEYSEKLSAANARRVVLEETRKKISAARIARGVSAAAIAKMRAARPAKPAAKLTAEIVRQIRSEYQPGRGAYAALGRKYGVKLHTIRRLILNETWQDVR